MRGSAPWRCGASRSSSTVRISTHSSTCTAGSGSVPWRSCGYVIEVLFLGTGGARFVVARQFRASGGMWMRFGTTQIHVDPGPGALVRALSQVPPCNPRDLSGIVLSHKHLDHSNDVNVMIEAM